ncbi:hypothetical protein BDW02DRAFT_610524 [Decorospora gaudefroyi]|uniref:SRR1-like domain-containing protein n=1 Tax=Decorospora gaudefroyi TaxID=184978 RepID=A0A6A5K5D3_9PLEO|nr:hypothetical protein BDW02DRAFT_610524 [Decorospora gaudefroyi]
MTSDETSNAAINRAVDQAVNHLDDLTAMSRETSTEAGFEDGLYDEQWITSEEEPYLDKNEAFSHRFDLMASEVERRGRPIYTRALLTRIQASRDTLLQELQRPATERNLRGLVLFPRNGHGVRIWDEQENFRADSIDVAYMPRLALHSEVQSKYPELSNQTMLLRRYNPNRTEKHFDVPYSFRTFARTWYDEHKYFGRMNKYWEALTHTKSLWLKSASRRKLIATIENSLAQSTPIDKVVCFGIGAFNLNPNWYDAAIQYLAIFDIVKTLNTAYQKKDPNHPRIKMLFQDPFYESRDLQLLHRQWGMERKHEIEFVSDPDGLLSIDAKTMVVTAFLPFQVPLMQIIADLFTENPDRGPAAVICDSMHLDPNQRKYGFRERASPAVARVFTEHYAKKAGGFSDHVLGEELGRDLRGHRWDERGRYWLTRMDMFTRML